MFTSQNRKWGVSSLIGAVFIMLIFISGYSLFMFNAKLLIGTIDDGSDLVISTWDGSSISYQTQLSSDLGVNNREGMDIEFNLFGDPEEFTGKVEIEGVSPLETWGDLTWNVDSSITASESFVTLQLFNYNAGSYPTSGDGYKSYTSTAANESAQVSITSGVSQYVSGGEVKIRLTSQYSDGFSQNVNKVQLDYSTRAVYVAADSNGRYIINLKSSTWSGETFKLRVLVGSVAAEKTVVQAHGGHKQSD